MTDFQVGDQVLTTVNNVKVHGTVESVQLAKNLVDVKIYEPGNPSHCLIVARPPDQVTLASEEPAQSSGTAAGIGITVADIKASFAQVSADMASLGLRVAQLETLPSRVASIENLLGAVQSLQTRMDSIQSRVAGLEKVNLSAPNVQESGAAAATATTSMPAVKQ